MKQTDDQKKRYILSQIVHSAKSFTFKPLAASDSLLDFRQGSKSLETKDLGWVVAERGAPLAFYFPKSFGISTLQELVDHLKR